MGGGDVLLLNEKLAIAIFEANDDEDDDDLGQIVLSENEVFKFFFCFCDGICRGGGDCFGLGGICSVV